MKPHPPVTRFSRTGSPFARRQPAARCARTMNVSQTRLFLSAVLAANLTCGHAIARERPETAPAARFLQDTINDAIDLARPPVAAQAESGLDALVVISIDLANLTHFALGQYGAK